MTPSAHLPCGPRMLSRKFRDFGPEAQGPPAQALPPSGCHTMGTLPSPGRISFAVCPAPPAPCPCPRLPVTLWRLLPVCVGGAQGDLPPEVEAEGPAALFTEPSLGQVSCPSQRAGMGGRLEAPGMRSCHSLADPLTIRQGSAWPLSPPHTRRPVFGGV